MSFAVWIVIIFAFFVFSVWTYRYVIRPTIEKRDIIKKMYTPKIASAHHLFNRLYEGIDGKKIASAEKKRLKLNDDALTYGEVAFESFVLMLQFVKPEADEIFYDLGCGMGKAVFIASLLFPFKKARGIEILPAMHQACEKQLEQFKRLIKQTPQFNAYFCNIEFIHNDILNVDFFNANVVYVNSTAFFGELWEKIVDRLCQLKSGARVIVTSRYLPEDKFDLLDDRRRLMSWGMSTVRIYRRKFCSLGDGESTRLPSLDELI